jgi:hypothetical protein
MIGGMAEPTPLERLTRWLIERPTRCQTCKSEIAKGQRFCSGECEFEHVQSIP